MEKYSFIQKIASGSFGNVSKVKCLATGSTMAIKEFNNSFFSGEGIYTSTFRDVTLLSKTYHQNLVHSNDIFIHDNKICAVMDFASHTLVDFIGKADIAPVILYQLLQGVKYLHDNRIMHRDLKPDNVLIIGNSVKITDFGYSVVVPQSSHNLPYSTTTFSSSFRPPEVIFGDQYYSFSADMWCVGGEKVTTI